MLEIPSRTGQGLLAQVILHLCRNLTWLRNSGTEETFPFEPIAHFPNTGAPRCGSCSSCCTPGPKIPWAYLVTCPAMLHPMAASPCAAHHDSNRSGFKSMVTSLPNSRCVHTRRFCHNTSLAFACNRFASACVQLALESRLQQEGTPHPFSCTPITMPYRLRQSRHAQ